MFELYLQCSSRFQRQPAKIWWEIPQCEWGNWDFSVTLLFKQQQWHQLSLVNSELSFTWNTCTFSQRVKEKEDKLVTERWSVDFSCNHYIQGIIKTMFVTMTLERNFFFFKEASWCIFFSLPRECSGLINNCHFFAKYISDTICDDHTLKKKKVTGFWISCQVQIYFFTHGHFAKKNYISCNVKVQYLHQSQRQKNCLEFIFMYSCISNYT